MEQILDQPESYKIENPLENTASTKKRFANFIVDSICLLIIQFLLGVIIAIVIVASGGQIPEEEDIQTKMFNFLLGLIGSFAYYFILESVFGKSVGKFITKTKVVTENGMKPDSKAIALRCLCRFIPFEPFSYFGSEVGWHDRYSKTLVINEKPKVQ